VDAPPSSASRLLEARAAGFDMVEGGGGAVMAKGAFASYQRRCAATVDD